jgi:hypothetical protein
VSLSPIANPLDTKGNVDDSTSDVIWVPSEQAGGASNLGGGVASTFLIRTAVVPCLL